MKKRLVLAVGTAAAAFVLTAGQPAFALTDAHKTLFTKATNGDCSACHKPHRAAGSERLFPIAPSSAAINNYGFIGAFCAEHCHGGVPAYPGATLMDTALYGTGGIGGGATGVNPASHGVGHVIANRPAHTVIPSTLPYGNNGNGVPAMLGSGFTAGFECTTCHNPHKNATLPVADASEALLTLDIDALCDECHTARGAGDGTWAGYGDGNTIGSHPVGVNVTGDNDGTGNSPVDIGVGNGPGASSFDDDYGAASGGHNLGGHLINGATNTGVTCVTCHAVHGSQPDGGAVTRPVEDLLVIAQGAQGTAEPAYRANGAGDGSNALCQACHAYNLASATSWNPGGTAFSHPSSGRFATLDTGIAGSASLTALAQSWPFGSATSAGTMDVGVICESCHAPHPNTGAGTYGAVANSHILRAQETAICNECHNVSMPNHHPIGAMPARYGDDPIAGTDGNTANLSCADCHSGTSGAHNWASASALAINSNWEPADNGRAADTTSHTGTGGASYVANTSKECVDCHLGGTNVASPTDGTVQGQLEVIGTNTGTHYIGPSTNAVGSHGDLSLGSRGATGATTAFNAFTQSFPAGGWSRFGGTAATSYVMVCESCHELEPDKNDSAALLLLNQLEDEVKASSDLCTSCHGLRPGGVSVHPVSNDVISKAADAGRTPTTLITTGASYANAAGAPNAAEYPADNQMNCDSCHQVHMAADASGTYILEYNTGSGTGLGAITVYGQVLDNNADSAQNINFNSLCEQCHTY